MVLIKIFATKFDGSLDKNTGDYYINEAQISDIFSSTRVIHMVNKDTFALNELEYQKLIKLLSPHAILNREA